VVSLTKSMALELARDNIRVNALATGYFSTELNPAASSRSKAGICWRWAEGRLDPPENQAAALPPVCRREFRRRALGIERVARFGDPAGASPKSAGSGSSAQVTA
jgi:NAD(P)-dependent dehydrogenase (short-subunit alcohol dehydrogenase family)